MHTHTLNTLVHNACKMSFSISLCHLFSPIILIVLTYFLSCLNTPPSLVPLWIYLMYEVTWENYYTFNTVGFLTMFSYLLWFDIVFLWYFQGDVGPPGPPGPVSTISEQKLDFLCTHHFQQVVFYSLRIMFSRRKQWPKNIVAKQALVSDTATVKMSEL